MHEQKTSNILDTTLERFLIVNKTITLEKTNIEIYSTRTVPMVEGLESEKIITSRIRKKKTGLVSTFGQDTPVVEDHLKAFSLKHSRPQLY